MKNSIYLLIAIAGLLTGCGVSNEYFTSTCSRENPYQCGAKCYSTAQQAQAAGCSNPIYWGN